MQQMWKGVPLIFLACVLTIVSPFQAKSVSATESVVAFGDSITAGWPYQTWSGNGCYYCGGYEIFLQDFISYDSDDMAVYNYGVPGEMTGDGYNRIDSVMSEASPQYVLLMEGTNDLTFYVDSSTVAYMVYAMAWRIRLWGAVPIVATITPDTRYDGSTDWKNVGYTNALIKYYVESDSSICLSDQYTAIAPYWGSGYSYDGLHPNWWGYWIMAQTWFNDLTNLKQCSY